MSLVSEGIKVEQWTKVCNYRKHMLKLNALIALKINLVQR